MGLDMYLTRHIHVCNYSFDTAGQQMSAAIMQALGIKHPEHYANGSINIDLPAAYWRKANAIHGWFVQNVQGGNDDCRRYPVTHDQLNELRTLCQDALEGKHPKSALPPTDGFFFGNTSDDEYYREYLKHTIEQLDRVLDPANAVSEHDYFYYQSSW